MAQSREAQGWASVDANAASPVPDRRGVKGELTVR